VKKADYFERRLSKNPSIVSRRIADEFILVPIRQKAGDIESIFTLNEVAGRIWELIDGEKSVGEIHDIIVEEFEVTPEVVKADIEEFLTHLEQMGALKTN
jgi:hypothetical protein